MCDARIFFQQFKRRKQAEEEQPEGENSDTKGPQCTKRGVEVYDVTYVSRVSLFFNTWMDSFDLTCDAPRLPARPIGIQKITTNTSFLCVIMEDNGIKGESETKKDYDIFRDSPLRYLGYANEVGESFRYQFPKLVTPSYALAFSYCLADAATSGYDTYDQARKAGSSTAVRESTISTLDTLLWQSLASVAIPGAAINVVVKACRSVIKRSPNVLPVTIATWLPTTVGLTSIPIIIKPIDEGVDLLMDSTFRKVVK